MLTQLVSPIFFQQAGDGRDKASDARAERNMGDPMLAFVALLVPAVIGAFTFHHWIFAHFVAAEYRHESALLGWMLITGGALVIGQLATFFPLVHGNSRVLVRVKILTAIVGVGFNVA